MPLRIIVELLSDLLGAIPVIGDDIEGALANWLAGVSSVADTAMVTANGKPSMEQILMISSLWMSINDDGDSIFRANLSNGAAAGTSLGGSSGGGSHSHGLGQIPDYQPVGQGNNYVEIAFIKATSRPAATARSDSSPATHRPSPASKRLHRGVSGQPDHREPDPVQHLVGDHRHQRARSPTRTPSSASLGCHHQRHPGPGSPSGCCRKRASCRHAHRW